MLLSLFIAVFVVAYGVRGWHRGLVREVVDLVGLVASVALTAVLWPVGAGLVRLVSPLDGAAANGIGGAMILVPALAGVLVLSRWLARERDTFPGAGSALDAAGAAAFSSSWGVLFVTALLVLATTVPGARLRTGATVCNAPLGRYLVGESNPLQPGGARLADLARPAMVWVGEHLFETLTLAPGDTVEVDVCADLPVGTPLQAASGEAFRFPPAQADSLSPDPAAAAVILQRLNQARAGAGLAPLQADPALAAVGHEHARDMYVRGFFAHETPECATGSTAPGCRGPFDRIRAAGIRYSVAGENLALAPTPDAVHDGLMESPSHRANILSPEYAYVGIGVVRGPFGLMVAQEFRS